MSPTVPIPRTMLRVPAEAAASMGVSEDFFQKHVQSELNLVYRGSLILVRLGELERWALNNEIRTLG